MKHSILCVDDEVDNVDALERLFRRKYNVYKATSGAAALKILKKNKVALIISDQRMPEMTGVEFLKRSMDFYPDAIRILLTGYTDIDSVIGAINAGQVYRYVTKPWDPVDLTNTVDKAIEKYDLRMELEEKNKALQKALDELKTLDEAKNHFMVLVNHELKTPLTVMSSFLQLLEESPLGDDEKKYLKRISESSDKLRKIVDDVLALVSAETGLLKVNPKKIAAAKLLSGIESRFEQKAQKKNQSIVLNADDVDVKADAKIIQSVVDRLVDNAIKFGDKDSQIQIEVKALEGEAEIAVINSGKPLLPKTIEKILKPFTLDEDIMHHSQGLGLGLSLCQALLKGHGSQLQFECSNGYVRALFKLALG